MNDRVYALILLALTTIFHPSCSPSFIGSVGSGELDGDQDDGDQDDGDPGDPDTSGPPLTGLIYRLNPKTDLLNSRVGETLSSVGSTYATGVKNVPFVDDSNYIFFPGANANDFRNTMGSALLPTTTTNLDFRARVAATQWSATTVRHIFGYMSSTGGYEFKLRSGGNIGVSLRTNGGSIHAQSSAAIGVSDGSWLWVRATVNVATKRFNFYTSSDGSTWTMLGSSDVVGSSNWDFINIPGASQELRIGASAYTVNSVENFDGGISHLRILHGIEGTAALDLDLSNASEAADTITDSVASYSFTRVSSEELSSGNPAGLSVVTKPKLFFPGNTTAYLRASLDQIWSKDDVTVVFVSSRFKGSVANDDGDERADWCLGEFGVNNPVNGAISSTSSSGQSTSETAVFRVDFSAAANGGISSKNALMSTSFAHAKNLPFVKYAYFGSDGYEGFTNSGVSIIADETYDSLGGFSLATPMGPSQIQYAQSDEYFHIGASYRTGAAVSKFLKGYVYEVLVYDRKLSASERGQLFEYLNEAYGTGAFP